MYERDKRKKELHTSILAAHRHEALSNHVVERAWQPANIINESLAAQGCGRHPRLRRASKVAAGRCQSASS